MNPLRALALVALSTLLPGCGILGPDDDDDLRPFSGDAEVTALFIGNSLTATNDLPAMVRTLAEAAGRTFEYRTILRSNHSLEDHWNAGAADVVRTLGADVVIMQQGPSSVGTNPQHLATWSGMFATVAREAGGEPALLMVWPDVGRLHAFDAVRESYRGAAEAVDGIFIPAGEAWRAVWEVFPGLAFYGPDGFHPSTRGTFAAAVTVFEVLFDEDARQLPPLVIAPAEAEAVYEGVHAAVEEWATAPSPAVR